MPLLLVFLEAGLAGKRLSSGQVGWGINEGIGPEVETTFLGAQAPRVHPVTAECL